MVPKTIVNGAYKPSYNWGAPHCMLNNQRVNGGTMVSLHSSAPFENITGEISIRDDLRKHPPKNGPWEKNGW